MTADRRQLAEPPEPKWVGGTGLDRGEHVPGTLESLSHRVLGRRWTVAASRHIGDQRRITQGPEVLIAFDPQEFVHENTPSILRQCQLPDQGVRAVSDWANHRRRYDHLAVRQHHAVPGGLGHPGPEDNFHTPFPQFCLSKFAEIRIKLLQDPFAGMDQDCAVSSPARPRIERQHGPDQVIDLPDRFHAAVSAADRDDGEELLSHSLIGLQIRLFQAAQHPVPQVEGIDQCLDRIGMLGHPRYSGQIHLEPEAPDQMVIAQYALPPLIAAQQGRGLGFQIEMSHGCAVELHGGAELANRMEDVPRLDGAGHDLRQERLEDEEVLIVDQVDLNRRIFPSQPPQLSCDTDAGEPSAQDDNASRLGSGHAGDSDFWQMSLKFTALQGEKQAPIVAKARMKINPPNGLKPKRGISSIVLSGTGWTPNTALATIRVTPMRIEVLCMIKQAEHDLVIARKTVAIEAYEVAAFLAEPAVEK